MEEVVNKTIRQETIVTAWAKVRGSDDNAVVRVGRGLKGKQYEQ